MADFYQRINELEKTVKTVMATVVKCPNEGGLEGLGEKALWSEGKYLEHGGNVVWQDLGEELGNITAPKLLRHNGFEILAEAVSGTPKLIICGGGHLSVPVAKIGKMLGFEVTVIDDRLSFAHKERFPEADHVWCEDFKEALAKIPEDANNYFVVVTRGHKYDQICLRQILDKAHAYIGMIGSKSRVRLVKQAMIEDGVSPELVETVYTPIGLKIGAETPEEIGVCIIAEIIQVKNSSRAGGGLSKEIMQAILAEEMQKTPKALVTIISRKGSAPRQIGTKMLVLAGGKCIGTIGGGCVEAEVYRQALLTLDDGKYRSLQVDMTGRNAEEDGMVCGGVVEVFVELV